VAGKHKPVIGPRYPPDFLDTQNVPHGTVREETYYSTALGKHRRLLVYTPPNYDCSPHSPFPVLYLYYGRGDTRYSWVTEVRLPEILDNLLAEEGRPDDCGGPRGSRLRC